MSKTIYRVPLLPNLSTRDHIELESPPLNSTLSLRPDSVDTGFGLSHSVHAIVSRGDDTIIDLAACRILSSVASYMDFLLDRGWTVVGACLPQEEEDRICKESKYSFDDEFQPVGLKHPPKDESEPPRTADEASVSPFPPTPWSVQKKTDSDYDEYTTIVAANGCEVTAATTFCNEGGVSGARPDLSAADAERIVACVNACAAFTTEELVKDKLAILKDPAMANLHRVELVQPAAEPECPCCNTETTVCSGVDAASSGWVATVERKMADLRSISDWAAITGLGTVRDHCNIAISRLKNEIERFQPPATKPN